VALASKARRIPFVVVSGNSREYRPPGFAGAPSVSKPVERSTLLQMPYMTALGQNAKTQIEYNESA